MLLVLAGCATDPPHHRRHDATETGSGSTETSVLPTSTTTTTVDQLEFVDLQLGPGGSGCALLSTGRLACWGDEGWVEAVPELSLELQTFDLGWYSKCGLDTEGRIHCWCQDTANDDMCGSEPGGSYAALAVEEGYGAAQQADGTLRWFGTQSGLHQANVVDAPSDAFSSYAVANAISCGVRLDGSLTCWGQTDFFSPYEIADGDFGLGEAPPLDLSYTRVAVGKRFACALDVDGELHCWGVDDWHVEFPDAPPGPFVQVAAGSYSACAVRAEGQLECWGTDHLAPLPSIQTEAPAGEFRAVALGGYDACAITADGKSIVCWGDDDPTSPLPSL